MILKVKIFTLTFVFPARNNIETFQFEDEGGVCTQAETNTRRRLDFKLSSRIIKKYTPWKVARLFFIEGF